MKPIIHNYRVLPYTYNSIVTSPKGDLIQEQHVKGSQNNYKVIYNGDVTIVILEDGSKGIAKRNPSDTYNRQIGHDIAFKRAKIKSLKKEIMRLSETGFVKERRL